MKESTWDSVCTPTKGVNLGQGVDSNKGVNLGQGVDSNEGVSLGQLPPATLVPNFYYDNMKLCLYPRMLRRDTLRYTGIKFHQSL